MPQAYGQPNRKEYANELAIIESKGAAFVTFIATNRYFVLPKTSEAPAPRESNAENRLD